jgi:branched-chain amino acid transport system substrate-binding protein
MGFQPNYQSEGRIYAKYIVEHHPAGMVAVLFQNDDYGKDVLKGLKDGLGAKTWLIVAEMPYETADPTVDSQIVRLKASGADIFVHIATPKFAAQAIKKVAELGWKPTHILNNVAGSIGSVLRPAGLDNAKGLLSTGYTKDQTDPTWNDDPAMKEWRAFMEKYFPEGDRTSSFTLYGYAVAQTLVQASQFGVIEPRHIGGRDRRNRRRGAGESGAQTRAHGKYHHSRGQLPRRKRIQPPRHAWR